jgi:hypothetical protein
MPEPGTDMAPGRRWRYVPRELVAVIVLQLAGAGAGVAAALAAGSAGPARAPGAAVAGMAGPQEAGVRWLVLAGAVALVLAVPVAAWWLIGDRYSTLYPSPISSSVIRPFPISPAAERAAGRGAVLAAIVAATWLTWASLRHEFDLRWWSVLGPLLLAGILAGFGWRVLTARMDGANIGAGCLILSGGPVVAALLGWAVTRSLTLL